jgi:hypothetical protein
MYVQRSLGLFMSALLAAEKVTGYVGRLEKLVELTLALYASLATMISFFCGLLHSSLTHLPHQH